MRNYSGITGPPEPFRGAHRRGFLLVLAAFWLLTGAFAFSQQIVVTVSQTDGDSMRGYLEAALVGEFFDAGYIVWSDTPQGVWVGSRSGDTRLPLQAEYTAVRHVRDQGASFLVQVHMAEPDRFYQDDLHYSVIDVVEPTVIAAGSLVPADIVDREKGVPGQAAEVARAIASEAVPALGRDSEAW